MKGVLVDGEANFFASLLAVERGGVSSRKAVGLAIAWVGRTAVMGWKEEVDVVEVADAVEETEKLRSWRVASSLVVMVERDMVGG